MAQVKWQKRAENELYRYLVKGVIEFGETTANNFAAKVSSLNKDLGKFPEIGYPEPLLKGRKKLDIVHIADIWDTRREPTKLANRIK